MAGTGLATQRIEYAATALACCAPCALGIRSGAGAHSRSGHKNLKDYPIEANPERIVRSVVPNRTLYQGRLGRGVKHSLTRAS